MDGSRSPVAHGSWAWGVRLVELVNRTATWRMAACTATWLLGRVDQRLWACLHSAGVGCLHRSLGVRAAHQHCARHMPVAFVSQPCAVAWLLSALDRIHRRFMVLHSAYVRYRSRLRALRTVC